MILEVNRLAMLEISKCVAKVAPSNSPVDVLNGVLVECNEDTGEVFLTATNHEVSIQQKLHASVKQSGSMLINANLLVGMMARLEGEFVALSADSPHLIKVAGGRCTFRLNCLPSKSYPKPIMPFPEESIIMTGICSLSNRTTFAVSKDESKPALQCVQIKLKNNAVHAAACDSVRMMLVKVTADSPAEREFLLPGRALQMLASISKDDDVFEVSDIDNEVVFVRGDMIFTIRKLHTGEYLNTAAVVGGIKPAYSSIVDVSKMKDALDAISVATMIGGTKRPLNLVMSNGEVVLRCNSEYSEAISPFPANVTLETPETGFYYEASALLKLFQVLNGKAKIEIDAKGFMLVKTRNEAYFQAPVYPPTKKSKDVKQDKEPKRAKGAKEVKETKEQSDTAA